MRAGSQQGRKWNRRKHTQHGSDAYSDLAVHGELERVGEQVEHDLLPHVLVHVHRLLQLFTLDHQSHISPVNAIEREREREK
jgi:hypothetical protein